MRFIINGKLESRGLFFKTLMS